MTSGIQNFRLSDYLVSPEKIQAYVEDVLEDGDAEELREAHGFVAEALKIPANWLKFEFGSEGEVRILVERLVNVDVGGQFQQQIAVVDLKDLNSP